MITYAVVPSNGRDCLEGCVKAILPQVSQLIVVANGPNAVPLGHKLPGVICLRDEPNISHWWNIGLDEAERQARVRRAAEWNVIILNDDVVPPPHLVETLSEAMRRTGATIAYPDQFLHNHEILHTKPGPVDMRTRITGYAFMVRGESELRADERFVWWYGDDDLDWRARMLGGSLLVPGCDVEHLYPNGWQAEFGELTHQTALDREMFRLIWGKLPH